MLSPEAIDGKSGLQYFFNVSEPSEPSANIAEKCLAREAQLRNLPYLTRPIEQFSDVQQLVEVAFCKLKKTLSVEEHSIVSFVQKLKESAKFPQEVIETIGIIIYLGEQDCRKVASLIEKRDVKASLAALKSAFLEEYVQLNVSIKEAVNHQYYSDIFDYQQTERSKKVLLIANFLVTKDGCINSGLIPVVIQHCLSDQDQYQKEVITILNALYYASTHSSNIPFTEHFADVCPPENQLSEVSDVVRATIQIPLNDELSARHCKVAILAALLTHDNEKVPPSLFTKQVLAERMDRFIVQLSCCIKHGKVDISGNEIRASWVLNDALLDKKIEIRKEGTVSKLQTSYWGQSFVKWWYPPYELGKVPSISRAYKMIGIGDFSSTDREIIKRLFKNTLASSKVVDINQVLWEAAALSVRPGTSKEVITPAYRRGVLGLISETACPLLFVWRKLIKQAEKTEALDARYMRIQRCIENVFSKAITDKMDQYRMKQIYRIFCDNLRDNVRVHEGYNFLYTTKEEAVDSPEKFKNLIEFLFSKTKDALVTTIHSDAEREGYSQLFGKLQVIVIDSHDFAQQFAGAYDPRNYGTKSSGTYPHNNPWNEHKEFEPPTFFTSFDDIDTFKDSTNQRPKSVGKFVEQWINQLRNTQEEKETHSSIKKMMDNKQSIEALLSEHLMQPGLEVSTSEIRTERKEQFAKLVKCKFVPSLQYINFDNKASKLVEGTSIISMFGNHLLKIVLDCVELDDGDRDKTTLAFTNLFIEELLLPEERKAIHDHALHLGPSNWRSSKTGSTDTFIAFFNPLTNGICLGTFDGYRVNLLDQYDMIENGFLDALLSE